jgi:methionyl-tRNA formyltransferase
MVKLAILYPERDLVGPEYLRALDAADIEVAQVIAVGQFTDDQITRERERTGGLWNVPAIPDSRIDATFENLRDPDLWKILRKDDIDIAVQCGVGILKTEMLSTPRVGFLNVHPGKLPEYRGNSCPEWAVRYGDDVHMTAHLIDDGIDTGPVILSRRYDVDPKWSYEAFRANIYAACAEAVVEAISALDRAGSDWRILLQRQSEENACYHRPIPQDDMVRVRSSFPGWKPVRRFEEIRPVC